MTSASLLATRHARRIAATVAAFTLTAGLIAGCSSDSDDGGSANSLLDGSSQSGTAGDAADADDTAGSHACSEYSGKLIALDPKAGEPKISIPQPSGWTRNTQMDSALIRLALINSGLTKKNFAPNLVVTVENSPTDDFQQNVDGQRRALKNTVKGKLPEGLQSEVCGYDSYTLTYTAPAMGQIPKRPVTAKIIVVPKGDGTATTIGLTIQTTDDKNSTYQRDSMTMLEQVQIVQDNNA